MGRYREYFLVKLEQCCSCASAWRYMSKFSQIGTQEVKKDEIEPIIDLLYSVDYKGISIYQLLSFLNAMTAGCKNMQIFVSA